MSSFMKIHTGNLPLSCSRGQATVSFGKDLAPRLWVRGGGTYDALFSRSASPRRPPLSRPVFVPTLVIWTILQRDRIFG